MKKWFVLLFISISLYSSARTNTEGKQPNVIIIFSDDQGYGDLSCHGNPVLKTPNLDKLYDQSIRFDDFHTASVCTPSRGELMTGLYAMRNKAMMVPAGRNLLRLDVPTMPEVFAANGYSTGLFGKWHLGDNYPYRPMDRGFQRVVWHKGWGFRSEIEYDNSYYTPRYYDEMEVKNSKKFCADLWFDEAMEWMDAQIDKKQPFFTYLSLNTPHKPFDPLPEDLALFEGKVQSKDVARFFALIYNIDRNFGRLDDWMKERGITDNTVIIYMTDNGTSRGYQIYNAGMKGHKGSQYEGGHRGICFIRWPEGYLGQPRTIHGVAHITDIMPTLIDLIGMNSSQITPFDGISLKNVLHGMEAKIKNRKAIVQYGGRIRPNKHSWSAVLWDNWRLIDGVELYDISKDPGQENDVINNHPGIAKELQQFYDDYWASVKTLIETVEPIWVGHDVEKSVDLTCNNWIEADIDTQHWIARGSRNRNTLQREGPWQIKAVSAGKYRIRLSRWPFHLNRPLDMMGPSKSIGGEPIEAGNALPIKIAALTLDNGNTHRITWDRKENFVEFELDLDEGLHRIQGWFEDGERKPICGAFYATVEKL